ncbi:hypothetical protein HK102_004063 [Quaeritorhiza haematococci]|nr:hypothetical protein HK102_004063 [Quaeritorhiza haematococci]
MNSHKNIITLRHSHVKTPGGEQNVKFLTRTGLFKIMMRSKTAFAERFQDWVADVITEIQETGHCRYQLQKESKARLIEFQQEKAAIEARAEEEQKRAEEAKTAKKGSRSQGHRFGRVSTVVFETR